MTFSLQVWVVLFVDCEAIIGMAVSTTIKELNKKISTDSSELT